MFALLLCALHTPSNVLLVLVHECVYYHASCYLPGIYPENGRPIVFQDNGIFKI